MVKVVECANKDINRKTHKNLEKLMTYSFLGLKGHESDDYQ